MVRLIHFCLLMSLLGNIFFYGGVLPGAIYSTQLVLGLSAMLYVWCGFFKHQQYPIVWGTKLDHAYLTFVLFAAASCFQAFHISYTTGPLSAILLGYLVFSLSGSLLRWHYLRYVFLLLIFFVLLLSFWQILNASFLPLSVKKIFYTERFTGTFVNPNHFGALLGMLLPLTPFLIFKQNVKARLLGFFSLLIMLLAIYQTKSLGVWVSLIGSVVIYVALYDRFVFKNFRLKKMILGVCLFVFSLVIFCLVAAPELSVLQAKSYSLWQRQALYAGFWNLFTLEQLVSLKHLFFGFGLGTFPFHFQGHYQKFDLVNFFHLHNHYLEMLVEIGLLGLLSFLAVIIVSLTSLYRMLVKETDKEKQLFEIGVFASLSFFYFHLLFDFDLVIPALNLMFVFLLSCISVCEHDLSSRVGSPFVFPIRSHLFRVMMSCFCLFFLVFVGREALGYYQVARIRQDIQKNYHLGAYRFVENIGRLSADSVSLKYELASFLQYLAFSTQNREAREDLYKEALLLVDEMITINPYYPAFYVHAARICFYLNLPDRVDAYFLKAIQANPKLLITYLERMKLSLYNNQIDSALQDLEFITVALKSIPEQGSRKMWLLDEIKHLFRSIDLTDKQKHLLKKIRSDD